MPLININNVSFTYSGSKTPALNGVNLSINEGEFFAVMGKNTSGKTTFCKLFNGLIPHLTEGMLLGQIIVNGLDAAVSSVPQLALICGIVLDDPDAQLFTSSVQEEVAFGPENLLFPADKIKERVKDALYAVGLTGFENRTVSGLSGGEKQRLSIACALAMNPKILVLDEPLCRLDPQWQDEVMAVLKKLNTNHKITIIMAAHESEKIRQFADRVCILKDGSIAACDKTQAIFADNALLKENGIQEPEQFDLNTVFSEAVSSNLQNPAIEIKNFSFYYSSENTVFKNLNLTINDNDFTGIIGKNGCGKTTLLKCITGLLRPASGELVIRGINANKLKVYEISEHIGFVMQNPSNQLFTDSVINEVSYALKNSKLSKAEIKERAEYALDIVKLKDKDAFPHALSAGDRSKAVIACVIAMGCKIILLDEIDVGQDYAGCMEIMNVIKELHSKGYTIIFVTHNMSLICNYADRLIIMEKDCNITEWERK